MKLSCTSPKIVCFLHTVVSAVPALEEILSVTVSGSQRLRSAPACIKHIQILVHSHTRYNPDKCYHLQQVSLCNSNVVCSTVLFFFSSALLSDTPQICESATLLICLIWFFFHPPRDLSADPWQTDGQRAS